MVYAPLPERWSSGYGKFCQVKPLLNCIGYRLPEARQNRKLPRISRLSQGCNEQFIEAPGIRGMVMLDLRCRALIGYSKSSKTSSRRERDVCRSRSCLLSTGERARPVGRMADTQEFENFVLEKRHIPRH